MTEQEEKHRILKTAYQLFFRYGFRATTMDALADELGMSKKTIYAHFGDKRNLVAQVTAQKLESDTRAKNQIWQQAQNAIEAMVGLTEHMKKSTTDMNPILLVELKKYYPKAWQTFRQYTQGEILNAIVELLRQGQREGHFTESFEPEILARMRLAQFEMVFDPEIYPHGRFNYQQIHEQLIDHFVRGLMRPESLPHYEKLKAQTPPIQTSETPGELF